MRDSHQPKAKPDRRPETGRDGQDTLGLTCVALGPWGAAHGMVLRECVFVVSPELGSRHLVRGFTGVVYDARFSHSAC